MLFSEILSERTLADVGVRGGKFYLSARGENMDLEEFCRTGRLEGIRGISSTKYIWADFGPNMGRDLLFVMNAADVLKLNRVSRVGYDNPDDLIADNSKNLGRILSVKDVARDPSDNLIQGVLAKIPNIKEIMGHDDINTVSNRAQFIAHALKRGRDFEPTDEMFKGIDTSAFGDWKQNGLRLTSYEDYANLYYQAAKAAGWYGKNSVKFFAPQNRSKWLPAIRAGIAGQAAIYSDESEWVNKGDTFIVPPSTTILVAVDPHLKKRPENYDEDPNAMVHMVRWSKFDEERYQNTKKLLAALENSPFKVQVVDAAKAANQLVRTQGKRRGYS